MKGFDTLRVKSAVKSRNNMNLDRVHLTTAEFGQILPLFCEELVPGDKYNVKANFFSRMAPLVKPTYGKFSFKTVGAFVPYHQVADDAEAFLAGKTTWLGNTPHIRYIRVGAIVSLFAPGANALCASATATTHYDFKMVDGNGQTQYWALNNLGRFYYKILTCLGYTFSQNVDSQSTSQWYATERMKKLSAYPFLAFAKVYNDYMSQSQRYNTSSLSNLLHKIKHGVSSTNQYDASTGELLPGGIRAILDGIRLCYENDYFTSAWQNANTPLQTLEQVASMAVPESTGGLTATTADNITSIDSAQVQTNLWQGALGQRALDFLQAFDNWVRRNNYSGSRDVQQIYSRFGIKTDDYRSNFAHILFTDSAPISVGDVTAMASSSSETLGDYAGKGIMSSSKGMNFVSSDYGMLFILGYFTIRPLNAFGFDKTVLRSTPLDFYNPEFDGLGAEAISYGEIYADPLSPSESSPTLDNMVFGFTERYNSYRFGRDKITGQFRDFHSNAADNTWHTGRYLSAVRSAGQMVAQSTSMNQISPIDSEYNRMFSITSGDVDHFYLTCEFNVNAERPMLSLNQVPRLGEGDTVVPRNGNEIS